MSERNFRDDLMILPVDHLLGDWWGRRTRLEDAGVTPSLTFVSDALGNPVGGVRQGFTEADNLGLNLNFDLEKIWGIKGASFLATFSSRSGASLSAIDIHNVFTTQQVYGGSVFRVVDLAYQQKLLDGDLDFRIGRIGAADDFLVSPYNYIFVQNGFCGVPVGIFFNAPGMSSYPNATWGAMARVRPTDRTYVMGGVYNGDPSIRDPNRHGVDMSLNGPLFAIVETAYQVNHLADDTGLPGSYKAGIWYDGSAYTGFGATVLESAKQQLSLVPRVREGNYGFYGLFDQVILRFGSPDEKILRGLGVTGSVQAAPLTDRSQMPFFFTAGVLARGILPQRPRDVAGFGIVYGQFSNTLSNAQRLAQRIDPSVGVQTHETVLEWTYAFRFRDGAYFIQPDLQYIIRPGATGQIPNALATGVQVGFNF